jgi:hypothetical protein
MAYTRTFPVTPRARRPRRRRFDAARLLKRMWRWRRGVAAIWRRAHLSIKLTVAAALLVMLWAIVNLAYHVIRKPTELFYPVSGALAKPPAETWRQYGALFRHYATATISPELLAALAQVESAGDPVARTYWRWRFSWNPLKLYQPASSAVGMYQMTDPAFAEARHYCIRHHVVVADGPWYDGHSCWLNSFYTRIIPSHAIELTAVYLDRNVASLLARHGVAATPQQKETLAALIHLCGAGPAESYLRHGFRLGPGERCGDHEAAVYLARVNTAKRAFHRLAADDERRDLDP